MIDELKDEISDLTSRKRRADALLRGLNSENQKWVVCNRMLEENNKNLNGDVLLASAIITYGGMFTYSYRRELIKIWQRKAIEPNQMSVKEGFQI